MTLASVTPALGTSLALGGTPPRSWILGFLPTRPGDAGAHRERGKSLNQVVNALEFQPCFIWADGVLADGVVPVPECVEPECRGLPEIVIHDR
jgi:hypothetical protein